VINTKTHNAMTAACWRLKGRLVAFNKHYIDDVCDDQTKPEDIEFRFYYSKTKHDPKIPNYITTMDRCKEVVAEENGTCLDWLFVYLPRDSPESTDNIKLLVSEKDLDTIQLEKVCMYCVKAEYGQPYLTMVRNVRFVGYQEEKEGSGIMEYYSSGFQYEGVGIEKGFCSFPLVDISRDNGSVIAAHQGKFANGIYRAQLVTREVVEEVYKDFSTEDPHYSFYRHAVPEFIDPQLHPQFIPPTQLNILGTVPRKMAVILPDQSSIVESPISSAIVSNVPWGKPKKQPSILSAKDPRHKSENTPLFNAINKYKVLRCPPKSSYDKVRPWERQELAEAPPGICRKLTLDEALNGIPGVDYFERLNLSTSPGYPWVKHRPQGTLGSKWLFEVDEKEQISIKSEELKESLKFLEESLANGELPYVLAMIILKDEKLKERKIEDSNTRGFMVWPKEVQILAKKYFGAFNAFYHRTRAYHSGSPGMNIRSMEWDQLYRYLREVSEKGIDGDIQFFDGNLWTETVYESYQDIEWWYIQNDKDWCPRDAKIRYGLLKLNLHCAVIVHDVVVEVHSGIISGWFGTAFGNCLSNKRNTKLAFVELVAKATFDMWKKNCRLKVWGDDHLLAVSTLLLPVFNGDTISRWYGSYGINYTPADKSSSFGEPKNIIELEYLKSYFFEDRANHIVYPTFDRTSVDEIINWVHKPTKEEPNIWEQVQLNCTAALEFILFQKENARETYDKYRDTMIRLLQGNVRDINLLTFDEQIDLLIENKHYDEDLRHAAWVRPNSGKNYKNIFKKRETEGFEKHSKLFNPFQSGTTHFGTTPNLQSEPTKVDERPTRPGSRPHKRESDLFPLDESMISYSNIVKREIVADKFDVALTDPVGIIKTYNLPMDLVTNCQQAQGFYNNYLWKGNVKVTMVVSSTQFHQGMLYMGFVPCMSKTQTLINFDNKVSQSNLPNCGYVDVNRPQPLEMLINYAHPRSYIHANSASDTSIEGSLGTLIVAVWDQLAGATGASTSIPVTILVSFPDSEFYLPVAVDACVSLTEKRDILSATKRYEKCKKNSDLSRFETHGQSQSSESTTINYYQGVNNSNIGTETVGDQLDQTSNFQPETDVQVGGSKMDKPFVGVNPHPLAKKVSGYMNNKANIEFVDKLTNEGREQCPTQIGHFNREDDEMSLKWMLSIASFGGQIQWHATDMAGTQIFALLLTPSPINCSLRSAPVADVVLPQTIMDYLSGNFLYWRGRMNIHLKLPTTKFQSGMLRVSVVYGTYSATASLEEANCQFMSYIDLKEDKREFNYTVEFPSTTQFLQTSSLHRSQMTLAQLREVAVGMLYIHVINPLVVGSGAPTTVNLQSFYSGPELEYFFLKPASVIIEATEGAMRTNNRGQPNLKAKQRFMTEKGYIQRRDSDPAKDFEKVEKFEKHSAVTPENSTVPLASQPQMAADGIVLGTKPKTPHVFYQKLNLLPTTSLRDLIRRYHLIYKGDLPNNNTAMAFDYQYIQNLGTQPTQILCMYVGFRGEARWKVFKCYTGNAKDTLTYAYWRPVGSSQGQAISSQFQEFFSITDGSGQTAIEAETSQTHEYNFMINNHFVDAGDLYLTEPGQFCVRQSGFTAATGSAATAHVFWAGGDAFRAGLFVGPGWCTVKFAQP